MPVLTTLMPDQRATSVGAPIIHLPRKLGKSVGHARLRARVALARWLWTPGPFAQPMNGGARLACQFLPGSTAGSIYCSSFTKTQEPLTLSCHGILRCGSSC